MVIGLWYTHIPNFGSLSWFWRCKEHPCPLSPDLGLWRMLEVPDWGLASWSWLGYGHWSLIYPCSEFWLSILILKVQRTSLSFKCWFVLWGTLKVPFCGWACWLDHWLLIKLSLGMWLSKTILKIERTYMSSQSESGPFRIIEASISLKLWLDWRVCWS